MRHCLLAFRFARSFVFSSTSPHELIRAFESWEDGAQDQKARPMFVSTIFLSPTLFFQKKFVSRGGTSRCGGVEPIDEKFVDETRANGGCGCSLSLTNFGGDFEAIEQFGDRNASFRCEQHEFLR